MYPGSYYFQITVTPAACMLYSTHCYCSLGKKKFNVNFSACMKFRDHVENDLDSPHKCECQLICPVKNACTVCSMLLASIMIMPAEFTKA